MTDGLVVVDKPTGWTSHDVVAKLRRVAGTRRVGHAGTLDPMATGVLVVGIGQGTRLLGHLALTDKEYDATIRLGVTTTTDDADGDVVETVDDSAVEGISDAAIAAATRGLTGELSQVPAAVSAIRVDGVRAYQRVRAGETVDLEPRSVRVECFDIVTRRGQQLDVHVACSTGTYVRALARDLGAALGVGAHLTALRRTRVGAFALSSARTIEELETDLRLISLDEAVATAFPRLTVDAEQAARIAHGQRLVLDLPADPTGVFDPDGRVVALVQDRDGVAQPMCVFAVRSE